MHRPTTITVDLVADQHIWEFAPGRAVSGYAYNSQVPGPAITAVAGDTLAVRLINRLPEPTTIHWHGLRVPAAMDGTQAVQRPVPPGGSFEYRFLMPDAGTFWYHPHTNETEQLEKGLYGALVVREPDEVPLDGEQVLLLDDLKLDRADRLARFGGRRERHDGRIGETLLVNGQIDPVLAISAGQIQRWRVLNAASSRYVLLSIGGRPFTLLGTGGGLIEAPVTVTELLLPPACRAELAVGPYAAGERLDIDALPYSRGMVKESGGHLATVRAGVGQPSKARIPSTLRHIDPLVDGLVEPNRTVHLGGRMSLLRGVDWFVDGHAHHHADPVHIGELQVWDVVNDTRMDHPFHLHGFFFQVLEVNGKPPTFASLDDTVNVPARGRVRIVWLPDDRPGTWMYHCHILEHHAAGMMAHFDVLPARHSTGSADAAFAQHAGTHPASHTSVHTH
ncbi:MAG: multicopper oxidase type 3 [Propionibacteriaceae bacterium]|jgi:FtsP/CotA-like multicopper oxidase with cupredoxin domain|nr:multicopper oxidase type 3 [Propionibacteriaceae bacterium]